MFRVQRSKLASVLLSAATSSLRTTGSKIGPSSSKGAPASRLLQPGRGYYSWNSVNQYRQPSNWGGDRVVLGLIGANVAGWVAWQSNPDFMSRHAVVSEGALRQGRFHTLLTSCFSHQAGGHLAANMFTLYFFGGSLANAVGGARFLRLYVLGGVAGNLAYVGLRYWQQRSSSWRHDPGALGASGSVNSVVVCQILLNPRATVLLYGILPLPAWALGVGWIGLDVMGAARGPSMGGGTAYAGHLGGAAVGALAYHRWFRRRF